MLATSACGGGERPASATAAAVTSAATSAAPATTSPPPTTAAPTTAAPTTTVAPAAGFDEAAANALRVSTELAALRMACFTADDTAPCFVNADPEMAAAETAAIEAVTAMGAAATAAGLPAEQCEDYVQYTAGNIATERQALIQRATDVVLGDSSPGTPEWDYFNVLLSERIAPAGHELALLIIDCVDGVRNLTAEVTLAQNVSSFVFNADVRTRPSLSYNLWTVLFCIDRPPVEGRSCYDALNVADPLVSHLEELGYAYDDLVADPGYADLPADCRAAIEEATSRLQSTYASFLDLSTRELVGTDIALLESLAQAVHQVEYQNRLSATVPLYPLDETTVLGCAAAVADLTS